MLGAALRAQRAVSLNIRLIRGLAVPGRVAVLMTQTLILASATSSTYRSQDSAPPSATSTGPEGTAWNPRLRDDPEG